MGADWLGTIPTSPPDSTVRLPHDGARLPSRPGRVNSDGLHVVSNSNEAPKLTRLAGEARQAGERRRRWLVSVAATWNWTQKAKEGQQDEIGGLQFRCEIH